MMSEAQFTFAELAEATGGKWFRLPALSGKRVSITTDTRTDNQGKIFFALVGERFDAHDFLDKAQHSGCAALCVNEARLDKVPADIPVLAVSDTLRAYQACGNFHRRRFPQLTVVGVTGSVGKTSTKEMIRAILSAEAGEEQVLYTVGNTNNQIGVVQNLLRLNEGHRFAVIEMGTSAPGEIAPLAQTALPQSALVNSIAACHLEKLIDYAGVAREKGTIFAPLPADGTAVFPAECFAAGELTEAAGKHRILRFGDGKGDVRAVWKSGDIVSCEFTLAFPDGGKCDVSLPLAGRHQMLNGAAAAAVAFSLGIKPETIAAGLAHTALPGMRMKRTRINGATIFNDAYNANPASMKASLELLAANPVPGRLILLLGGMRELGTNSRAEHQTLLENAAELLPQAEVVTIGSEFAGLNARHFDQAEEAGTFLRNFLRPGDTLFAKGSRGNRVELALPQEAR